MNIPPEIKQMIAQARRQRPELSKASDEQIAGLIMQAMNS